MTRLDICYHEAGHVVTSAMLGVKYGAAVFEKSGCAGPSDMLKPPAPENYTPEKLDAIHETDDLLELFKKSLIVAGGCAATQMFAPVVVVDGTDRAMLTSMTKEAFEGDFECSRLFIQLAVARARMLLYRRWAAVESVATALNEKGTLTADDVQKLIEAAP
jgi:hypothetical protein